MEVSTVNIHKRHRLIVQRNLFGHDQFSRLLFLCSGGKVVSPRERICMTGFDGLTFDSMAWWSTGA